MNLLEHIKNHILSHGYPPSIRELQELTGAPSTNTIWRALRKLEASGDITVEKGQSRAIRLNNYYVTLLEEMDRVIKKDGSRYFLAPGWGWTPMPSAGKDLTAYSPGSFGFWGDKGDEYYNILPPEDADD